MSDFHYHAVSPQRPDGIAPRLENVMLASGWRRSPKSLYDWMWLPGRPTLSCMWRSAVTWSDRSASSAV